MRTSTNYDLKLVEGTDIVNPLVNDVPNYEKIDEVMKENSDAGVTKATELLSGSVHALTRENSDASMFRFTATSQYKSGETFTVDGVQVTALLPSGETLPTGGYVIGSNVLCCLTGTLMTVYLGAGGEIVANDSEKLGGQLPDYYATATQNQQAVALAQAANDIGVSNTEKIDRIDGQLGGLDARSCTIGQIGTSWKLSSTYKNIGSKGELFPPIDNQYFTSTSGDDASITVKQSGLYIVECLMSATGATTTASGYVRGRITVDDSTSTLVSKNMCGWIYGSSSYGRYWMTKVMYLEAGMKLKFEVSSNVSVLNSTGSDTMVVTKLL